MSILGTIGTIFTKLLPSIITAGANWLSNLGKSQPVKPDTPVQTIEDISESLDGLRDIILKEIKPAVDSANDEVTSYIADQLEMFEANSEVIAKHEISISGVRSRLKAIPDRAKENWELEIRQKISLDNPDCRAILKLPPGAKKESDTQKFIEVVLVESLENYSKFFRREVDGIYDGIMEDAKRTVLRIEAKAREISEISEAMNSKDDGKLEELISKANTKIFAYNLLIEKARF